MTELKLTDSIIRSTSDFDAPASISDDGKKIYIVYDISVLKPGQLIAELFKNKDGKLVSKRKIFGDVKYVSIDSGFASVNFDYFTLLDDDQINNARLRLFDKNFKLVATKIFNDFYPVGYSFYGGKFSDDGKYIAVSYIYKNTKDTQYSVIKILNAESLKLIAEYKYKGNTYASPKFLYYNNDTYVLFESTQGTFDFGNPIPKPPSKLNVLKFKNNKLILIDTTLLPQSSNFDISYCGNKVYITVGTRRADLKDEIIIHKKPNPSFLKHDGDELRFYKFDGKFKLINKINTKENTTVIFYPNLKKILLAKETENSLGEFSIVDLHDWQLKESSIPYFALQFFNAQFSNNGEWLITTGSYPDYTGTDKYGLKNIQLYKINKKH